MKTTSKMKMTSKMKTTFKTKTTSKKLFGPPLKRILPEIFWWPLTSTATGQLILNRKCYQVFKPEMELHMINIVYAALSMREQIEKTTFLWKDDQCKPLHLYWSGVNGLVHWRSTHRAGRIPGIFSLHAPTLLCGIFSYIGMIYLLGKIKDKIFWKYGHPNEHKLVLHSFRCCV